jgi:phosphatidylglycerol---prolipoprotein diacylglyceryl transferase
MRRILFTCCGLNIYSYPAMLYLGLVAGILVGAQIAQSSGIDPDRFALASVILLIPGLLGARLLYVLMHWEIYAGDPRRIWQRHEGGMAMYGGFAMIVAFSIPLLRALRLPIAAFWDAGVFTILIAMIFARVGCLLNGCCAGRPTDGWWGLNLPDHRGVYRQRVPSQMLEMAWSGLVLIVLLVWRSRAPVAGALFWGGVGAYGIGRFFLQKLRDDEGGARESSVLQGISAILALSAVLAGFLLMRAK